MKKIAVILSGCGVYDGSEIYESVLTLLEIAKNGAEYQCMAPNIEQFHVINHLSGDIAENEKRNVLTEAARLARGDIIDLATAKAEDYDALIIPGGFGAAKNLSDFAINGSNCQVNGDVAAFTQAMHKAGKPVGLICITPAISPLLFGNDVKFTLGNDIDTIQTAEAMGGTHINCAVNDIVVDETLKVVTTPAYMLAGSITEAAAGIEKLVKKVLLLA
ncbi:isoprenoid biosynthesis glyoxalase ElbB [Neptuniibacter sp. 2_MG-2023]|jgi:enhancing lycopene biosynthesis protein 2|uniref:isoprenoid biosynthesis glyoxalase ElbB n=1 Tax=Neptuniibacter sp. 2_MG-2023 TaxID=3062671 RepID=UPI0026E147BC|nr:isoprenoid biosynthesis glyoxalase ElbB [Neptuniibacter sp. 2_MG-2023]MDO6515261.1 isoprenoid biosynthesis glyoxalase ElbB [Neptuniibacter sp. 2_MG-2023]